MRTVFITALITISVVLFLLTLIAHTYGRTTASVVLTFLLGLVGLIFGAAAIGVWLS